MQPENIHSLNVLDKLDFEFEGTLRQYEKVEDGYIDLHMYSKLKNEWNSKNRGAS